MHFHSEIIIDRAPETVGAWLDDASNLPRWDRSVAQVIPTSSGQAAIGFTFDTIAPNGLRMSYRITDHVPLHHTTIALVGSPMFRVAIWRMRYDRVGAATRVACDVSLALRPRYLLLGIPLRLAQRSALARDLRQLKAAIEGDSAA